MSSTSRLDPRIQRTRAAIVTAFQELLSERGLRPLTIQDIAEQAGVNRVTFYAHYRDKYDLFGQLIHAHLDATLTEQVRRPLHLDATGLRDLLTALCVFMTQVYDQCHVHDDEMEVHIERQVHEQVTVWVHEALSLRQQQPNSRVISRDMLTTMIVSGLYTAASGWGRRASGQALDRYVAEAMVFLAGGLAASGFGAPDRRPPP